MACFKQLILIVICVWAVTARAQYPDIPRRIDLLKWESRIDTADVHQLIRQGNELIYDYPDSSIKLFTKAVEWSRGIGYYSGISKALINLGSCYVVKEDYNKAIYLFKKALPYCIVFGEGHYRELSSFCIDISVAYIHLGKNDSAFAYLLKGLDVAERVRDTQQMIRIYANISGLWTNNQLYAKSIPYAQKGISLALQLQDSNALPQLYGIMASNSREDRTKSLYYLHRAIELAGSDQQKKYMLAKAGATYLHNGMPDSAVFYLRKRIAMEDLNSQLGDFDVYSNLALAYYLVNQKEDALYYMTQALKMAEMSGRRNLNLATTWYNMADILISMGRYKEAVHYLKPYADLRDSLLGAQRNKAFDLLDVKYRTSEKDKKIMAQQLQLEIEHRKAARKNIWVAGVIIGLVFVITFGFIFYRDLRHKQRNQQNQLLLMQQQKEMALLKAGIKGEEKERTRIAYELHDGIGGMLAAIKMNFSAVQERYEALYGLSELTPIINMVDDTSDELRKTVQNLIPGVLLKHRLSEALRIYCSNINATRKLKISLQLYGDLDNLSKEFELMLYRFIQELIQNIIKHAQAEIAVVELEHTNGKYHILVEDNGEGFDTHTPGNGGFGLENLRYRVNALQGYISIESAKGRGTTINITFDEKKVKNFFV